MCVGPLWCSRAQAAYAVAEGLYISVRLWWLSRCCRDQKLPWQTQHWTIHELSQGTNLSQSWGLNESWARRGAGAESSCSKFSGHDSSFELNQLIAHWMVRCSVDAWWAEELHQLLPEVWLELLACQSAQQKEFYSPQTILKWRPQQPSAWWCKASKWSGWQLSSDYKYLPLVEADLWCHCVYDQNGLMVEGTLEWVTWCGDENLNSGNSYKSLSIRACFCWWKARYNAALCECLNAKGSATSETRGNAGPEELEDVDYWLSHHTARFYHLPEEHHEIGDP